MQGCFKHSECTLPPELLAKMIFNHSTGEQSQVLDKLVKQLNWADYGYLSELESLCQQKLLVGSIFHIQMCQTKKTSHFKKCRKVLFVMFKMLT
jgi:hypothetical protein